MATLAQEIAAAKAAARAASAKSTKQPPAKQPPAKQSGPTKESVSAAQAKVQAAQKQLESLKTSGAAALEQATMSTITAAKTIDRIAERQMGTTGQAMPVGGGEFYTPGQAGSVQQQEPISGERRDAFKLIEDAFRGYGLEELIPEIQKYMVGFTDEKGNRVMIGPNEAEVMLKQTPAYQKRFAGNVERLKRGLNAYSPGEYIRAENEYSTLFKEYGQTSFANKQEYANLIGNDISYVELGKRLKLASDAWDQADPMVKAALKEFYPAITDADAIGYFLKPEQKLPELQTKVTAAQIGGEALRQGYKTTAATAEEFARAGIGQAEARAGYADVAAALPTAGKLSQIYGEANIPYTQRTAEEEFILQQQSAAEKRKRLASLERAKFGGASGIDMNISPFSRKGGRGEF